MLNATGASSYVPDCIGAEKVSRFRERDSVPEGNVRISSRKTAKPLKVGESVLVWGDHYAAVDTVAYLASIGKQVTVVTEKKEFGSTVEVVHMYVMRKRFKQEEAEALEPKPYKYPVTVIENSTVYEVKDGEVVDTGQEFQPQHDTGIDTVITCHTRPNRKLFDELKAQGVTVFNAGDAVSPRNLHAAVIGRR